jgi:hypothetical protein
MSGETHEGFDADRWINVLLIGTMEATADEKQYGPGVTLPVLHNGLTRGFRHHRSSAVRRQCINR